MIHICSFSETCILLYVLDCLILHSSAGITTLRSLLRGIFRGHEQFSCFPASLSPALQHLSHMCTWTTDGAWVKEDLAEKKSMRETQTESEKTGLCGQGGLDAGSAYLHSRAHGGWTWSKSLGTPTKSTYHPLGPIPMLPWIVPCC